MVTDEDVDALYEAGCDDASIVSCNGVTYMAFDREADSLEAAIGSAVGDVLNAGYLVGRAEVGDTGAPEGSNRVVWEAESLVQEMLGEYFCHFAALSGCYHQVDSAGNALGHSGVFHYSGFILDLGEQWYWVTAAHVFDHKEVGVEARRREGSISIDECTLNDSFTASGGKWNPIPFNYWDYDSVCCYDEAQGLDFCAVKLSGHHRQLLEANGVVPLSEENWQHDDLSHFDGFCLIGLPQELEDTSITAESDGYHVKTKPTPAAVYVSRVEHVPTDCVKPTPRFVGRVQEQAGNVEGMSGGPIFGVHESDPTHFLIALQSSWLRQRRLVFGCPIGTVIQHLSRGQRDSDTGAERV